MSNSKILLACEESQRVTIEFRKLGYEAYSCDLLECSGNHPEWHIQDDVLNVVNDGWDMIIAFPPCTYLTVTGNRWFNVERYGEKALDRMKERESAAKFFMEFTDLKARYVAIENPVGVMSTLYRKPDQIIQPYMFGDGFEKRTCLWLKNLPLLIPTDIVEPEPRIKYKSGKTMPAWYQVSGKDRAKIRSKTFPGIAKAMAKQWGCLL